MPQRSRSNPAAGSARAVANNDWGETANALAATVDEVDTARMLVSSWMVMMIVPSLALSHGGLVRAKNFLPVLMLQVLVVASRAVGGVRWTQRSCGSARIGRSRAHDAARPHLAFTQPIVPVCA